MSDAMEKLEMKKRLDAAMEWLADVTIPVGSVNTRSR